MAILYKDVVKDVKKLKSCFEIKMIYIRDKLHIIDTNDKVHFIWKEKTKQCQMQTIPKELRSSCMVSTRFSRYLIIFGGYSGSVKNPFFSNAIFICDLLENRIVKSNVKCPGKRLYHASITDDEDSDNLLTLQFIQNCYESENYHDFQPLPLYLEHFIVQSVCNQEIYLIEKGSGQRWKIDVDHVLEAL